MRASEVHAGQSAPCEAPDPRAAVVIITRNRATELLRALDRMSSLPERPEIVVVDNGSTDGTPEAVEARHPSIKVLRMGRNAGAAGRTEGVRLLSRPYVAFCDDDCWWTPGSIRLGADLLDAHPRLALISGRVLVGDEETEDPTCREMEKSPLAFDPTLPGSPILGFLAGASIVRRAAFLEAGGFERRFHLGGEERLLALDLTAAGWSLAYVKEIVVHHHPSERREGPERRRAIARNAFWIAWLRAPAPQALRRTLRLLRSGLSDRVLLEGFIEAARALPWVLRHRRALPASIARDLRKVEGSV